MAFVINLHGSAIYMLLTGPTATNPVHAAKFQELTYIPYKHGIHFRNSLFAVRVSCLAYIHRFNGRQVFQFSLKKIALYNKDQVTLCFSVYTFLLL